MTLFSEYTTVQELLVSAAILSMVYLVGRRFTRRSEHDGKTLPPSIGSFPIIGSLPFLPNVRKIHHWSLEKSYKLGAVFSFKIGNQYTFLLNSHEAIREAFLQRSVHYADREDHFSSPFFSPNGKGLIFHKYDEEYKKYHQMSLSILKQFGFGKNIMEARILLEVSELIEKIKVLKGQAFDPREKFTHAIQSIISRIVFGQPIDPEDKAEKKLMKYILDYGKHFMNLLPLDYLPSLRFLPYFRKVISDTKIIIEDQLEIIDRKIDCSLQQDAEESFVSHFAAKDGKEFDRDQLKVTIRDMILAATETTSATLMWALVLLANHPDVQECLLKEINSIVPRERQPSLDDMSKMKYMEATILELMRIKTVGAMGVPRSTLCDTEVGGYFIPKNSNIYPMLHSIHMNINAWKDPEEFQPDRFLDSAGNVINKDLVIPFCIGKRSCLGESLARQEIFLFLTGLVQQFNILPPEGCEKIDESEIMDGVISPKPFKCCFLLRN